MIKNTYLNKKLKTFLKIIGKGIKHVISIFCVKRTLKTVTIQKIQKLDFLKLAAQLQIKLGKYLLELS